MRFIINAKGDTFSEVADDVARNLSRASRASGREVAKAGTKAIRDAARGKRGHMRFRGKSLGVKSKVKPRPTGSTVELYASPAGAWAIVNDGAKPHLIQPRRARVLSFGPGEAAARANHPGTSGTGVWDQTEGPLTRAVTDEVEDVFDEVFD